MSPLNKMWTQDTGKNKRQFWWSPYQSIRSWLGSSISFVNPYRTVGCIFDLGSKVNNNIYSYTLNSVLRRRHVSVAI